MKVAITGGSSILASEIRCRLIDYGHEVTLYSRNRSQGYFDLSQFSRNDFFGEDIVIHLAHDYRILDRYMAIVREFSIYLKKSNHINILISSMSAHCKNASNYSKYKLAMESLFQSQNSPTIRLGIVSIRGNSSTQTRSVRRLNWFLRFYPFPIAKNTQYYISSVEKICLDLESIIVRCSAISSSLVVDSFSEGPLTLSELREYEGKNPKFVFGNSRVNFFILKVLNVFHNYLTAADKIINFLHGMKGRMDK